MKDVLTKYTLNLLMDNSDGSKVSKQEINLKKKNPRNQKKSIKLPKKELDQ